MNLTLNNRHHLKLEVVIEEQDQSNGVFIIVGGSGKIDLNGNHRMFKMNIYRDVSDELNKLGYTSIRYSKRGTGQSEGSHNETGLIDLIEDLEDIVNYAKDKYPTHKIYLLGHSEGAMIITLFCKTNTVDGIVLISGAGIGLKDALQLQNTYLAKEIKHLSGLKGKLLRLLVSKKKIDKQQQKIFNKVEQSNKNVIRVQLVPIAAKWMREHFQYISEDYLDILKQTTIPTLVLQGDKDAHTSTSFTDSIKQLEKENISVVVLENIDHILRDYDGELSILNIKKQYKKEVKQSISMKAKDALKDWVESV